MFPNFRGAHWDHDGMVKSKWKPLFKRLVARWQEQRRNDVPPYFNWHALRHFAISCWIDRATAQDRADLRRTFQLADHDGQVRHLFRSDRHNSAMDAIADGIKSETRPEPPKNAHWKWSDFTP